MITYVLKLKLEEVDKDALILSMNGKYGRTYVPGDGTIVFKGLVEQSVKDEIDAIVEANKEAKLDQPGNSRLEARRHRAHKQAITAINLVADADTKAALQKIHQEMHLLHRE